MIEQPRPVRRTRLPSHAWVRLALGASVVALAAGTFLPWLQSGSTSRSSYASAAALRELVLSGGPAATAVRAWSLVPVGCAGVLLLLLIGRGRSGAGLAVPVALLVGGVAVRALTVPGSDAPVHLARSGPLVTAVAAAIAVPIAIACLLLRPGDRRSR